MIILTADIWLMIKTTLLGKVGAFFVSSAPVILAVEMKNNHVDALIAAVPPTMAVIVGFLALKKGQARMFLKMDGHLSELMEVSKRAAKSEGKEEERVEARERTVEIPLAAGSEVSRIEVVNTEDNPVPTKPSKEKSKPPKSNPFK